MAPDTTDHGGHGRTGGRKRPGPAPDTCAADLRNAGEALRRSREHYLGLFDDFPNPIWRAGTDAKCNYFNREWLSFTGRTYEQEYGDGWAEGVHPDDFDRCLKTYLDAFGARQPFEMEYRLRHHDGTYHWLLDYGKPYFDPDGTFAGYIGSCYDTTRRRQAEDALRESEEKFRGIFDNINDAIELHEIRPDGLPGKYLVVNDVTCRMLGYTRGELLEKSPLDFAIPYHNRPIAEIGREILATGHSRFESGHRGRDGHVTPVEINAHLVTLGGRQMVLSVIRDITERKKAEETLSLTNRKLNLLSGITRHDINNQLLVLSAFLSIAQDSATDPAAVAEYLRKAERVTGVIREQIAFTREYQDLGVKAPSWQDAGALVKDALAALPAQGIAVESTVDGILVYADPLFGKVFYNLIDNALRYGGPGMTRIRITAHPQEHGIALVIGDDGAGISADDRQRLFEKGFGKSTGLGLFLSREILAITGITITENGEPGKGARFEISVPEGAYRRAG